VQKTSTVTHTRISLHSSLLHFLLAGESESQGEVAWTHEAQAKRGTFFCYLCPCAITRLLLAGKKTEKTATQAIPQFLIAFFKYT